MKLIIINKFITMYTISYNLNKFFFDSNRFNTIKLIGIKIFSNKKLNIQYLRYR